MGEAESSKGLNANQHGSMSSSTIYMTLNNGSQDGRDGDGSSDDMLGEVTMTTRTLHYTINLEGREGHVVDYDPSASSYSVKVGMWLGYVYVVSEYQYVHGAT